MGSVRPFSLEIRSGLWTPHQSDLYSNFGLSGFKNCDLKESEKVYLHGSST